MSRKSGATIEAGEIKRAGLYKEAKAMAERSRNSSGVPVESATTQTDIHAWYKEKLESLTGIPDSELTLAMRTFRAFMRMKLNK